MKRVYTEALAVPKRNFAVLSVSSRTLFRARGEPPTFLKIRKSYWEKVFLDTPHPSHFASLVSPTQPNPHPYPPTFKVAKRSLLLNIWENNCIP